VSPAAWEVLELVLAMLFVAGFFYYYVLGVHYEDRAMSRLAALAFLLSAVVAVVLLVRIFLL
jgi:heme/copper-type cytochrome/quinol oxidase subunit 1